MVPRLGERRPSLKNQSSNKPRLKADEEEFRIAAEEPEISFLREFWEFLKTNKRWWLGPVIVSLLLFMALVIFSSQAAIGPWIYAFF